VLEKRNLSESDLPTFVRGPSCFSKRPSRTTVRITPADVKDYYDKHRAAYDKARPQGNARDRNAADHRRCCATSR